MSSTQINYLNIGLMLVSCIAAFIVPFELFLFAYAVLGPLHYLTEISWLHEKGYFTKSRHDYLFLGLLCVALLIVSYVIKQQPHIENGLIYIAFVSALAMVLIKDTTIKVVAVAVTIVSVIFLKDVKPYQIFFAIFLPTIVHVFVFTGAFILVGALKGKSASGITSLIVFILTGSSFFLISPDFGYTVSRYGHDAYKTFEALNVAIIQIFHIGQLRSLEDLYQTQAGFIVMRFIAFSYCYHYLNWFSKTSIIKWHQISKQRFAFIGALWAISVGTYAYDYKIGVVALFFLSFLHVFLEFPLNHQTFILIGKELGSMGKSAEPDKSKREPKRKVVPTAA